MSKVRAMTFTLLAILLLLSGLLPQIAPEFAMYAGICLVSAGVLAIWFRHVICDIDDEKKVKAQPRSIFAVVRSRNLVFVGSVLVLLGFVAVFD